MIAKLTMLVAGAAIGLAAAAYGGMRYGKGVVFDDCMHQASRDVERLVATLKHVRAGEKDPALELVEAWLDGALVLFDPREPYPGLTPKTIGEMNQALQDAKAYRATHPRKSSRPQLDARIAELLSRGSYKQ